MGHDLVHDLFGQQAQGFALVFGEFARLAVDDAQGAKAIAVRIL